MSAQRSEVLQPRWKFVPRNPFRRGPAPVFGQRARSDILIAAAGLALAIGCALLPWYVFLNQEKFGIRALKFEGREGVIPSSGISHARLRQPISPDEIPIMELDLLSTGTLPGFGDDVEAVPLSQQPFPGQDRPPAEYRLIHVANGRAMMEDENGLWVVQLGSRLPDQSRVASIERRDGAWVVVTDSDRVITLAD